MPDDQVILNLVDTDGRLVNARVEIEDNAVILHSRGGPTGGRSARNPEYSQAFDLILDRLGATTAGVERVLVDSSAARALPVSERVVATKTDFQKLPLNKVKKQIRRGMRILGQEKEAAFGKGNSAKRLRFETTGIAADLRRIVGGHIVGATLGPEVDTALLGGEGELVAPPLHHTPEGSENSADHVNATAQQIHAATTDMPLTDEERRWVEGNLRVATHLRRERKAGLANAKRAVFQAKNGRLFCEKCNLDPVERYGREYGAEVALACIEVHHSKVRVADMEEDHETSLDDLECLCANCHRLVHRRMALAKW